jgi:proteasome ATPase
MTRQLLEAGPVDAKVKTLAALWLHGQDAGCRAAAGVFEQNRRLRTGLAEAEEGLARAQEVLDKLTAVPWSSAVFLRPVETGIEEPRAMILQGNSRRVVGLADGVDLDELAPGDEVFLSNQDNVIIAASPDGMPEFGEVAAFDRRAGDGRLILRWRDEEVVVHASAALRDATLEPGDQVRWDRGLWMAFEKIESASARSQFILEDAPNADRGLVGGQAANLQRLLAALTVILLDPAKAQRYGLACGRSVFMYGPPGCGKTLMSRVAAAELGRLSGKRVRFGVVKPAEWYDPYVGVTERNIRQCFAALREAARDGLAVLFMDEVEAVGRTRGHMSGYHSDRFLNALLSELDGFAERGNVAIISASNRKDLVDPALLERLSDQEIHVARPALDEAREIFQVHLPKSLPFSPNSDEAEATREAVIDLAVSRFYAPNGDNDLCSLRFRDGHTRTVRAAELVSGRLISQVCRTACQGAFLRDVRGSGAGIREEDMARAADEAIERLRTTLTVRNVHAYLADLPTDIDVVSVDPIRPNRVARPHEYVTLNVA